MVPAYIPVGNFDDAGKNVIMASVKQQQNKSLKI